MWSDIKIKWPWPFKPKKVSYEILPELTPGEKALKKILESKDLESEIRMSRRHKLGSGGVCCYCNKYQSNLAWHEARCPQRPTLAGRVRG